ncbi:MAG: pyridoxal-phosphate dependent enzyme [Candidatus Latescibacterota bacterium]|nr:MAG: pyridoxal-phosphate dependent enzyme [Candidatus Latescibacterota bacterium]
MVEFKHILSARNHLHPEIISTPMQLWRYASTLTGLSVHLKVESFQRTGSFKPRGAWNKIQMLSDEERARGVICASAGNHAQGVAFAASRIGAAATIVMPVTAPQVKIAETKLYGDPEIILYGDDIAESLVKAHELQQERGSVFIHAYDDDDVIAGQGTLGLEILEQCPEADTIVVPVGGGGLIAGVTLAVRELKPEVKIIGVQAKGSDAIVQSLEIGKPITLEQSSTIADGINVRTAGKRSVEILSRLQVPVMRVSDEEIRAAMIALSQKAKLVVEPSGAASSAVVLFYPDVFENSNHVVSIVSGANIDICCYASVLRAFPQKATEDIGIACASCTGGDQRRSCLGAAASLLAEQESGNED